MRVLLSDINTFLKDEISLNDALEIFERMGVEVEDHKTIGSEFENILLAKVLNVSKEGKLSWVKVETESGIYEVATTDEVYPGEILLWANVSPKELRDKTSYGMFLSEEELGLQGKSQSLARVKDPKNYHKEFLLGDVLFNLYITPNRPDLLGVLWLAKEIAQFSGIEFVSPELKDESTIDASFDVRLESPGCDLYTIRRIRLNKKGETPDILKRKLFLIGFNPISPAVDATNWTAYIVGQPLHAFDSQKVKDFIRVVDSIGSERFITLSGEEYELVEGLVCIADSEKILALGGVIGG